VLRGAGRPDSHGPDDREEGRATKEHSEFLQRLVGKQVRIIAVDEYRLPPMPAMVLREISSLGIVVEDSRTPHFFPWHEIVEIYPASGSVAEDRREGAEPASS
jgi:hypothetical protein